MNVVCKELKHLHNFTYFHKRSWNYKGYVPLFEKNSNIHSIQCGFILLQCLVNSREHIQHSFNFTNTVYRRKKLKVRYNRWQLNPFIPRVKPWVSECGSNFWVCGWKSSEWPFKWKLLSSTFMWCCLFLTIFRFFPLVLNLALLGVKGLKNSAEGINGLTRKPAEGEIANPMTQRLWNEVIENRIKIVKTLFLLKYFLTSIFSPVNSYTNTKRTLWSTSEEKG